MHSLTSVLAALQKEIEAALAGSETSHGAFRLEPDRVVVSLQVQVGPGDSNASSESAGVPNENEAGLIFIAPATGTAEGAGLSTGGLGPSVGHTLTIEFKIGSALSQAVPGTGRVPAQLPKEVSNSTARAIPDRSPTAVEEELAEVFGQPGFDSSARAMVFRELLEALSEEDMGALRRVLEGEPVTIFNENVRSARHTLLGLIRTGPLKNSERGVGLLSRLFATHSRQSLIAVIAERWKTQHDWLSS
jgi:hypothetical protein